MTLRLPFLESLIEDICDSKQAEPSHVEQLIEESKLGPVEFDVEVAGTVTPDRGPASMCSQAEAHEETKQLAAQIGDSKIAIYIPAKDRPEPKDVEKEYRFDICSTTLRSIYEITEVKIVLLLSSSVVGIYNSEKDEKYLFHTDEIVQDDLQIIQDQLDVSADQAALGEF